MPVNHSIAFLIWWYSAWLDCVAIRSIFILRHYQRTLLQKYVCQISPFNVRSSPLILCYMKANCELSPSRIQSGSSECHWSKDDRLCSLRPPPNDPVFIILVALLTTILSIPILLLFNFLLNGYASNYPGSRRLDDEVGEEEEIDSTNASKKSSTRNTTTSEILRNSTSTSAFGMKLRKGLPAGDTVDYRSMNITSQNSYIGKRKQSLDLKSFIVDVSSAA